MSDKSVIAYVAFVNAGHPPARNVRNQVKIEWFADGEKKHFEDVSISEPDVFEILSKMEVERGTAALAKSDVARYRAKEGFIFV